MTPRCIALSLLLCGCFNPESASPAAETETDAGTGGTTMGSMTSASPTGSMTSQGSQTSVTPPPTTEPGETTDGICGNETIEGDEECDGGEHGGASCSDFPSGVDGENYNTGAVSCTDECRLDVSDCGYSCQLSDCDLVCDPMTEACVECVDDTHCSADGPTPYCVDSICESCDVAGCEAPEPVCTSSGVCVEEPKVVFLTSTTYSGDLGGLDGADGHCATRATAAGLPGTFMAWLSDNATAVEDRFHQSSGQYVLVDGTVIANNWADLTDNTLDAQIGLDEFGDAPSVDPTGTCNSTESVWTGTFASGSGSVGLTLCADWTDATSTNSMKGVFTQLDGGWSFDCTSTDCVGPEHLYCFEQ